jgi:hypothetical protein
MGERMNLADIIQDYIARWRAPTERELRYYAIQRSLGDAIREAALSRLPSGKRHRHQRRIPLRVLESAERTLQRHADRLSKAKSFDELHKYVETVLSHIRGIGPLAVYDIAHRIGAYLKLEPKLIYLHAGARKGARALELNGNTLRPEEVPSELHSLRPAEIEDVLCIYADDLRLSQPPS